MKVRGWGTVLVLLLAAGVLLIASGALDVRLVWRGNEALAVDWFGSKSETPAAQPAPAPFWKTQPPTPEVQAPQGAPQSFADLAERVSKGVVNIQTSKTVVGQEFPRVFEEFFFGGPGQGQFPQREHKVPSLGSGFVISPDGYIVTNNHVVEDVDSIKVAFSDGQEEVDATVVGRDPKTDIALIRIKTNHELYALPLGDSERVRPGDWVVAIGNPFGLEHTVTAGIVSAKHRVIGQGSYDDFIQTDAAINPGNSGGALVDVSGNLIGVNTAIYSRTGGSMGIGFAIPVSLARKVMDQIIATGSVTRGWIGVEVQDITPDLADSFRLPTNSKGVLIATVIPGGPAARAGVKAGDILVEVEGKPVPDSSTMLNLVAEVQPGKLALLKVVRNSNPVTVKLTVGKRPKPRALRGEAEE